MYKRITVTLSDEDLIKPIDIPFSFQESRKICSELTPYDFKKSVQIAIAGADYISFSVNKIFGYIFVAEELLHPYAEKPIWGFTDEWKRNYIPPLDFTEEQITKLSDTWRINFEKPMIIGIDPAKEQSGN
jgi:hypothetical protein